MFEIPIVQRSNEDNTTVSSLILGKHMLAKLKITILLSKISKTYVNQYIL